MKIMVFDTETTSINKKFCYNVGYVIYDTENKLTLAQKDFVAEQVWHNPMLFSTAYYAEKRPLYVNRMRNRTATLKKFGYICQEMIRDIKKYGIEYAFAYNSNFDEDVFNFNCDWFKCNNPFDNVTILDIRGHAHHYIVNYDFPKFSKFCEDNERFTESGNYSTTAETIYQYITNDITFEEEHTALNDSIIELEILMKAVDNGAIITKGYTPLRSIERKVPKILTIKKGKDELATFECTGYTVYKSRDTINLK